VGKVSKAKTRGKKTWEGGEEKIKL